RRGDRMTAKMKRRDFMIASFALRHALPTTGESRETVAAGLLMSYGQNMLSPSPHWAPVPERVLSVNRGIPTTILAACCIAATLPRTGEEAGEGHRPRCSRPDRAGDRGNRRFHAAGAGEDVPGDGMSR